MQTNTILPISNQAFKFYVNCIEILNDAKASYEKKQKIFFKIYEFLYYFCTSAS